MAQRLVDIECVEQHRTDAAILIRTEEEDAKAEWLPLSQIEIDDSDPTGVLVITMPVWLAKEKGLI